MGPKMLTGHAQMHAGKCEGVKSENSKGEGDSRKWEGGDLKNILIKVKHLIKLK